MPNPPTKRISALDVLAYADLATADYIPIVDDSALTTKRVTIASIQQKSVDALTTEINDAVTAAEAAQTAAETAQTAAETAETNAEAAQAAAESAAATFGATPYATKAAMDAVTPGAPPVYGYVYADSTASNNGLYIYPSGGPAWVKDDSNVVDRLDTAEADITAAQADIDAIEANIDEIEYITGTVPLQQSRNRFDPNNGLAQREKYINNSNGNIDTLTKYAVPGAVPCTEAVPIVIDLSRAPANWSIYDLSTNGGVTFYSSSTIGLASRISRLNAAGGGVTYASAAKRIAYVTPPAGATHMCFSVLDTVGTAPTESDFEEFLTALMVYDGSPTKPLPIELTAIADHPKWRVVVEKSGDYFYVRVPYRDNDHACYKINAGYAFTDTANNGCVDFDGCRIIPASTLPSATKTAYDASSIIVTSGGDASPPIFINSMFLGGGHGVVSVKVTKTSHGKATVDIGSTYTDGAAKTWVITKIIDTDNFVVTAANTGTSTSWVINGSITGALTHASGGTNTGSITPDSTVGTQLWGIAQSYYWSAYVDGTRVLDDGVYEGSTFALTEEYGIPNAASLLAAIIAAVGSSTAPAYNDPSVQTQVKIFNAWKWDRLSPVFQNYQMVENVQTYTMGYMGGMQAQTMIKNGDDTLHMFVPRCTEGTFATGQDISANASSLTVASGEFTDAANPPDRFWQMTKRSSEQRHAYIMGYSKNQGTDRTDLNDAFNLSSSEKMYPYGVDDGVALNPTAGSIFELCGFQGAMDVNRDSSFQAKLLFRDAGKYSFYLMSTAAVTAKWVALPQELIGLPVTVTFNSGYTLSSTVVGPKGIRVSSSGAGELEVLIG